MHFRAKVMQGATVVGFSEWNTVPDVLVHDVILPTREALDAQWRGKTAVERKECGHPEDSHVSVEVVDADRPDEPAFRFTTQACLACMVITGPLTYPGGCELPWDCEL